MKLLSILLLISVIACSKTNHKRGISSDGPNYTFELPSNNKGTTTVPVYVLGGDANSFIGEANSEVINDNKSYDVVIIGGGLAGLSSAVYLSDYGKKVLLLEKEAHLGGLAASGKADGTTYDRGAAYWTGAYNEEMEILKHIGVGDYEKRYPIEEPIDSYLWNGKLYPGIWEHKTLKKLPITFSIFKREMEEASANGYIPDQPFEEYDKRGGKMDLDKLSARDWVRKMACANEKSKNRDAKKMAKALIKEKGHFDCAKGGVDTRMDDVLGLMDLYCRSALGSETQSISAMAFANFYISELVTRYTAPDGTGRAADNMIEMLKDRSKLVKIKNKATVSSIVQTDNGENPVEVTYVIQDEDGNRTTMKSKARFAVYAAQLKMAPKLVKGLKEKNPEQSALMEGMGYSHYSVHNAVVKGHPYRATYDTWVRAKDYTSDDFTDVILGRWMELNGYEGTRNFEKDPAGNTILSIYHPLPQKWMGKSYNDLEAAQLAEKAVRRAIEVLRPGLEQQSKNAKKQDLTMEFMSVKTSRWPFSVHVAVPGHFLKKAKILRKPFGKVFFANNNLGTPAFEEALFRGHCAANNIMMRLDSNFKNEEWSNCPIDKD